MTPPREIRIEAQKLAWEYGIAHAIIQKGMSFKVVREGQETQDGWAVVDWYHPETR